MMKNFQYYVTQGAGPDLSDAMITAELSGANFKTYGAQNDTKVGPYNFATSLSSVAQLLSAGDIPKATFSYNEAVDPLDTKGVATITVSTQNNQGTLGTLFGDLSGNAKVTLDLPAVAIDVPKKAVEKSAPSEFLITLEDRTSWLITTGNGGSGPIVANALGHGEVLGGLERRQRLAGRF